MTGRQTTLAALLALLPVTGHSMDISAKSAVIMDAQTGKVIWSKDPDTPRFPASTTKIMTGLLLLEHTLPTDMITAPTDVNKIGEASMHLKPGEQVSAHDMLYAMMLRSANDGCYAVATHISGSVDKFSDLMNERARQLGATHTHFHNPNGLNDPQHTISARDLALIAREAMKRPEFQEVVRTTKYEIRRSINQHDVRMVSKNKWLYKDASADGIKTGYTRPAGHCYVGSATRNGYRVITVIMKSDHWQSDHQQMLDWAFKNHQRQTLVTQGAPVLSPNVEGGSKPTLPLGVAAPVDTLLRKATAERVGGHNAVEPLFAGPLKAPIQKGQKVGTAKVRDAEGFEQVVDLVALDDDPLPPVARVVSNVASPNGFYAFCGTLALGTLLVRNRARTKRRFFGRSTPSKFF